MSARRLSSPTMSMCSEDATRLRIKPIFTCVQYLAIRMWAETSPTLRMERIIRVTHGRIVWREYSERWTNVVGQSCCANGRSSPAKWVAGVEVIHSAKSTDRREMHNLECRSGPYFEHHLFRLAIIDRVADKIVFTTQTNLWNVFIYEKVSGKQVSREGESLFTTDDHGVGVREQSIRFRISHCRRKNRCFRFFDSNSHNEFL